MLRIIVITLLLVNVGLITVQLLETEQQPAPTVVEAAPDDSGLPGLVLLSEMSDERQGAVGSAECFTLGPFEREEDRNNARREIAASAIAIAQRQTTAVVDRGTWVYLPVQPDYITARSMALTLRDAGFADADVVREGDWNNSVSLGFFSNKDNAEKLSREARSLGFKVDIRKVQAAEMRYWIDFEQRAGAPYPNTLGGSEFELAQLRSVPCPGDDAL